MIFNKSIGSRVRVTDKNGIEKAPLNAAIATPRGADSLYKIFNSKGVESGGEIAASLRDSQ